MKNGISVARPLHPRSLAVILVGALGLVALLTMLAPFARAHIVPPEKFHPVTEAYLRASFFLNLNPVTWRLVRDECRIIANDLRAAAAADPEAAKALRAMQHALQEVARKRQGGGEYSASPHRIECFAGATRALSWLTRQALRDTERQLDDYSLSRERLDRARQLYQAFEVSIQACDPTGYAQLGEAWLECANAMGHRGLAGVGSRAPNAEQMRRHAGTISAYLKANFEEADPQLHGYRLVAAPHASPTFVPGSQPPLKLPPGSNMNKQQPRPRQILNMITRGVDEKDTYLIALGDMVFDSSYIFGEPARSLGLTCNTCHNKGTTNPNFFIPGLSHQPNSLDVSNSFFNALANNGHWDPLDIPDLRGLRFLAPYGRNGRFASLRNFTRNVIVNEFAGMEPDPEILDGLVAYLLEFDFLPNPSLNRDGSLTAKASVAAHRGERVFSRKFASMNNRSCASCHVPSARFIDRQVHDIGSGAPSERDAIDTAFDTPTLINIKYSAPYFHDGSLPTIRSVNEWFNRRYQLGLSRQELDDLTAYVETVGEGVEPYEPAGSIVAPELEEFDIFMSVMEHAIPAQKRIIVETTARTVAFEVRAHKWDLQDLQYAPLMDRLADLAEGLAAAAVRGDWEAAMKHYRDYVALYEKHAEDLV